MATKSTYIIALVDYFCITDGLISKRNSIFRLYYCEHYCSHTPFSHETQELRLAPEAERKPYSTVRTFTLRIFFSFIANFLSCTTFSLPHTK